MKTQLTRYAVRILNALGLTADEGDIPECFVSNAVESKAYVIHGTSVRVSLAWFNGGTIRIDVDFSLPENGVLADTFMDHCAGIEKTPKDHEGHYSSGPKYRDWSSGLGRKKTFALSPWHNTMFYVRSENYTADEAEEAVTNAIALAKQFSDHLGDLPSLRYWKTTDPEVIAKAREIVLNADFTETDCDREEKAHWLVDRNSFFKGWFYPFYNKGKGSFDTIYKPFYAAIGIEGSFEYAVSCLLLFDGDYIAKARKACRIYEERTIVRF